MKIEIQNLIDKTYLSWINHEKDTSRSVETNQDWPKSSLNCVFKKLLKLRGWTKPCQKYSFSHKSLRDFLLKMMGKIYVMRNYCLIGVGKDIRGITKLGQGSRNKGNKISQLKVS